MKRGGSYKNSKRQGRQREVFINGLLPVGEIIQKKFPEQFQSNAEKSLQKFTKKTIQKFIHLK